MRMVRFLFVIFILSLLGCSMVNEVKGSQEKSSFEIFLLENRIQKDGDVYLYQGDVAFSESILQELYTESNNTFRGNIASIGSQRFVWNDVEKLNITYRFTSDMARGNLSNQQVRDAFREAADNWNQITEDIHIREVNANSVFDVKTFYQEYIVNENGGKSYAVARSFFPHSTSKYDLILNIAESDTYIISYDEMVCIFTHELGHSLGLAHEHQHADAPYDYNQGEWGENFGDYDEFSIMDYTNVYRVLGISAGDENLIKYLYDDIFRYQGIQTTSFGLSQGWISSTHPRMMADINGDSRSDIVGFAKNGVYVSIAEVDGTYQSQRLVSNLYGSDQGWTNSKHIRTMADVNGDNYDDIVAFGDTGVYVTLSNGNGTFQSSRLVLRQFSYAAGGWTIDKHPRMLADINGDNMDDIIGFAGSGVYISLAMGNGNFHPIKYVLGAFGYNQGWRNGKHPRMMADVNGDGKSDIVGFANNGVYVSLATNNGNFSTSKKLLARLVIMLVVGEWEITLG